VCRGPTGHPETVATGSASGAGNPSEGAQQPGTGARSSTLTVSQSSALAAQAEQEKLAGDLYQAFADKYPEVVFDRIAAAEDQHLAAVGQQLTVYGVDDPTAGQAPGEFATAALQTRYDQLLAQGMIGRSGALEVGVQVEKTTIADLQEALGGVMAASVQNVYENLLEASQQHLTAFTNWPGR